LKEFFGDALSEASQKEVGSGKDKKAGRQGIVNEITHGPPHLGAEPYRPSSFPFEERICKKIALISQGGVGMEEISELFHTFKG